MSTGPLRMGTLADARLDPGRVAHARAVISGCLPPFEGDGRYPSAVLLLARDGVVVVHEAYGDAVRYGKDGLLSPTDRVPARTDTRYDLASITKTVSAVALLALAERGLLSLDQPVRALLPAFDDDRVCVRRLLDHTAGFPATIDLWRRPADRAELLDRAVRSPLEAEPGSRYLYSDIGPILVGAIIERLTGARLDEVVAEMVTGPLGLAATGYLPACVQGCAATEAQPWTGRPMVHGEVHDENAWALDGVSAHAGLFGTAWDLAAFAQLLAGDGAYGGVRVLSPESVDAMVTGSLGVEKDRPSNTGALASPFTVGHTGFTGTSFVLDRRIRAVGVLLTNRVHPFRDNGTVTASRVAVAEALA